MLTVLPGWAQAGAAVQMPRFSYPTAATGPWPALNVAASRATQTTSLAGHPCGSCGPCLPDETSPTGCSKTCWTRRGPEGDCDQYDMECRGPGCNPTCAPGERLCGTTCVDTSSDPNHCGGCGTTCPPGSACCNGTCCPPGSTCCGNGCCPAGSTCCGDRCGGTTCPDGTHCCGPGEGFCSVDNMCCCPFPGMRCVSIRIFNITRNICLPT